MAVVKKGTSSDISRLGGSPRENKNGRTTELGFPTGLNHNGNIAGLQVLVGAEQPNCHQLLNLANSNTITLPSQRVLSPQSAALTSPSQTPVRTLTSPPRSRLCQPTTFYNAQAAKQAVLRIHTLYSTTPVTTQRWFMVRPLECTPGPSTTKPAIPLFLSQGSHDICGVAHLSAPSESFGQPEMQGPQYTT